MPSGVLLQVHLSGAGAVSWPRYPSRTIAPKGGVYALRGAPAGAYIRRRSGLL